MKKISAILACAAVSAMLLCACGSSDAGNSDSANAAGDAVENANEDAAATDVAGTDENTDTVMIPDTYYYDMKGTIVTVNAEMASLTDALGEPTNYFESESCAFQGLDKVYTYGSVVISTYPKDGVDYVYTIELKDDTVSTKEGICIGNSKDEVIAAYGEPTTENDTAISYEKGDCVLAFIFDGDSVTNITYTAVTE